MSDGKLLIVFVIAAVLVAGIVALCWRPGCARLRARGSR